MTEKIIELEKKLEATTKNEEIKSAEKSRYKPLARKLKEERNIFKERLITDNNSLCYHFDESQIKLEFFSVNIVSQLKLNYQQKGHPKA